MASHNTDTGDTINATTEINDNYNENQEPRESLITTAVSFLQNSKVQHTTLPQKQQFLKSKGLTMTEIELACQRAGVFTTPPNNCNPQTIISMGINSSEHLAVQPVRTTALGRLREILHSVALLSSLAYAIFFVWKKYIAPFLFGTKKKKPITDTLEEIDKKLETNLKIVNLQLTDVKETFLMQQRESSQQLNRELHSFRSDLDAIKGLLLNRKQFTAPLTAVAAPSIPPWQLVSATHHRRDRHSQSDDNEKVDDGGSGSGSGSSETEVVTKNSDSSLEIM